MAAAVRRARAKARPLFRNLFGDRFPVRWRRGTLGIWRGPGPNPFMVHGSVRGRCRPREVGERPRAEARSGPRAFPPASPSEAMPLPLWPHASAASSVASPWPWARTSSRPPDMSQNDRGTLHCTPIRGPERRRRASGRSSVRSRSTPRRMRSGPVQRCPQAGQTAGQGVAAAGIRRTPVDRPPRRRRRRGVGARNPAPLDCGRPGMREAAVASRPKGAAPSRGPSASARPAIRRLDSAARIASPPSAAARSATAASRSQQSASLKTSTGSRMPLSSSSPLECAGKSCSTAVKALGLSRISPSSARSHSRAARFTAVPEAV